MFKALVSCLVASDQKWTFSWLNHWINLMMQHGWLRIDLWPYWLSGHQLESCVCHIKILATQHLKFWNPPSYLVWWGNADCARSESCAFSTLIDWTPRSRFRVSLLVTNQFRLLCKVNLLCLLLVNIRNLIFDLILNIGCLSHRLCWTNFNLVLILSHPINNSLVGSFKIAYTLCYVLYKVCTFFNQVSPSRLLVLQSLNKNICFNLVHF